MSTLSNTKPSQALLASFFITFFLLLLSKVKSSDDLSFVFNKFSPKGKDLTFQGNASVLETGVLQLNKVGTDLPNESGGIARYVKPVHIWNKTTGEVASFVTFFSFVMETSVDPNRASDGLTFFLAPPNSPLRRAGGFFGLYNSTEYDSSYQTVALEFDTTGAPENPWDPGYPHIGINVNCVKSITTEKWDKRYGLNNVANVVIVYQAFSKTLTTFLIYPSIQSSITVSAKVDLKAILPEWVSVGFTGTTFKGRRATHEVLNWYFSSTLGANKDNNIALENMCYLLLHIK